MRTFTMTVVGAACWAVAAVLVYFFVRVVLPALSTDATAAAFIPVFAVFVGLFVVLGGASLLWPGARARAWFWLVTAAAGVLFFAMFGPEVAFSLSHPTEPRGFVPASLAAAAVVLIVVGGVVAFREVRRRSTIRSTGWRGAWLVASLGGLVLGAALTSWIAGSTAASGGIFSEAPTTSAVVVASETTFDRSQMSAGSGESLGLSSSIEIRPPTRSTSTPSASMFRCLRIRRPRWRFRQPMPARTSSIALSLVIATPGWRAPSRSSRPPRRVEELNSGCPGTAASRPSRPRHGGHNQRRVVEVD